MSEPKVQLVDPQGNMSVTGMSAVGVITASSFDGISNSTATGITGTPDLDVGIVTATSFVGQGKGHAAGLAGTPELNLGVTTATSFVGDATGKAAGLTGTPNLTVGLVTATGFAGNVTGTVTGNVTGLAVSITPGSNLGLGVCTAIQYHGDGSTLTGAGSSAYIAQNITASGAETIIDLSYGNLIYYDSSSNTTVGFASTSAAEQITFIRDTGNSYTITWPDRVKWNGNTTPTLINNVRDAAFQIFRFTTVDTGLNYNAWEELKDDPINFRLFSWGSNSQGELGLNQPGPTRISSPTQIGTESVWSKLPRKEAQRSYHQLGLKNDGTLWTWGINETGVLGINSNENTLARVSSPIQIPGTWGTDAFMMDGNATSHVVKTDGTLWCWGYNIGYGLLGQNDRINQSSPVQIPGSWSRISTGNQNIGTAGAIKTDGTLWSWGYAGYGQLGINNRTKRSSPVQVPGDTWNNVSLSDRNVLATKTDGTLWVWGTNGYGQLAANNDGPSGGKSSPVQIPGTDWTGNINSGTSLLGAIKGDGTLWLWGQNTQGIIGQNQPNNNNNHRSSPTQIPGTWSDLAIGSESVLATKTDGTAWGWGNNQPGTLGQNDVVTRSSPTQIPGTWHSVLTGGVSGSMGLKI